MPSTVAEIAAHIDREALATDCLEFVRVQSPTGEEEPGSQFLAELLEREGFPVTFHEAAPGRHNVLARLLGEGDGPALALNGHTDTIPIGDCVAPSRDDEWIHGRGAEDMKGGLVAMVHAATALKKAGVKLRGDLWLSGVIGHESPVGKKEGPRALIEQFHSGEVPADAVLIVEGPDKIWSASLGSAHWTMRIESDRESVHTVKVPYEKNPIRWVGRLLAAIERYSAELGKRPAHPLAGPESINLGIVQMGDFYNRLPRTGELVGTRRWTPGRTQHDIRAELEALVAPIAAESGLRISLDFSNPREPFETPREHRLTRAVLAAGAALTGVEPEIIGMGLVGDANLYVNEGGVPTVYYGPAHETAHSDHERVSIERLEHLAKLYALTAMEFCGVAA